MYTLKDRTIALTGIFQATRLVQQIARTGVIESDVFENSIKSVFKVDSNSVEDVYGDVNNLTYGLRTLLIQLGSGTNNKQDTKPRDIEVTKYVINIMVLERKLAKHPNMLREIAQSLENAKKQVDHFSYSHTNVIANLANIYKETVSTLKPRIIVNGEQNLLSNPDQANKIRALLLSAIRSAVLWRQCGGKRTQILFMRSTIINSAEEILDKIQGYDSN